MTEQEKQKLNESYNFTNHILATFTNHSWSRQQTRYDSIFISETIKKLQKLSNAIYALIEGKE